MHEFVYITPHLAFIYVAVLFVTGSNLFSCIFLASCIAALFAYRHPQVDKTTSNRVLDVGEFGPIAHRGAAEDAPENTLAAIREVSALQYKGVVIKLFKVFPHIIRGSCSFSKA